MLADVRGVNGGRGRPEHAVLRQQLGRRAAVGALARLVLRGLLGDVHVQRPGHPVLADGRLDDDVQLLGGHRAHGVDRGGHPEVVVVLHHADPVRPALRVLVVEPPLHPLQRHVDAAAQVAGVEQREPDAGGAGGLAQRLSHRVRVAVPGAAGAVVQVVELPHAGDPGERHLGVHGGGELGIRVRVELVRERVHPVPPRPERAAAAVGPATQSPVEGVRVRVGEARQHQPR